MLIIRSLSSPTASKIFNHCNQCFSLGNALDQSKIGEVASSSDAITRVFLALGTWHLGLVQLGLGWLRADGQTI